MIPQAYITEWREKVPWVEDHQVEQDLIISRALCEIYSEKLAQDTLAFRGGTALQKIFFKIPHRYSEDIDLVQIKPAAIGSILDLLRIKLQPWLGKPTIDQKKGRVTLRYKYISENEPKKLMKLKVEINTAEHFTALGYQKIPFTVDSAWFKGSVKITSFEIEEILATKLRALYQRKKGRDLFDFQKAFEEFPKISDEKIVTCFQQYLSQEGLKVSRAEYEKNLSLKLSSTSFTADISPLLAHTESAFSIPDASQNLIKRLISRLPGAPWKGS